VTFPILPLAPSVLEGYISETDLARQLNRSVRTLQRLAARQSGPPRIKIGRLVFYRIDSVRAWLAQQEKKPASSVPSRRQHLKRAS
jgi:predicted DNA-binding transcriptional regulator AlpA